MAFIIDNENYDNYYDNNNIENLLNAKLGSSENQKKHESDSDMEIIENKENYIEPINISELTPEILESVKHQHVDYINSESDKSENTNIYGKKESESESESESDSDSESETTKNDILNNRKKYNYMNYMDDIDDKESMTNESVDESVDYSSSNEMLEGINKNTTQNYEDDNENVDKVIQNIKYFTSNLNL